MVENDSRPVPPSVDWRRREEIFRHFEDAWQRGEPPTIEDCLPSDTERLPVLAEVAGIDLEYRLKRGERARVEDYLRRFPELAGDRGAVVQLIHIEHELRQRQEPQLALGDYLRRFPDYHAELGASAAPPGDTVHTEQKAAAGETGLDAALTGPYWAAPTTPAAGVLVAGVPSVPGYEILAELGRGGMGVVYKARQLSLKRIVALKMILSGVHAGEEELTRFRSEAEAVARLQHPNIVQIHDIGECAGLSYFSLEFVEGNTLARQTAGRPPAVAEAAALVETLARAIQHAHERGVVHRDLKPANVLLAADGIPKITDFGLAKQLEGDSGQTRTGAIMGTPSYMAPEQAAGNGRAVGPSADVYALGAILYELLTGEPPFRGKTVLETLDQVRTSEPVPPSRRRPGVPRDVETICLKCLQKEPGRRYASALALANDLARFRAGEPILARREGPLRRLLRKVRRHPRIAAAALLGGLALAVAVSFLVRYRTTSRVAALQQAVRSPVGIKEWTEDRLRQLEADLAELDALAADVAAVERSQLYQRLFDAGHQLTTKLAAEGQDEEQVARVQRYVVLLKTRDQALGKTLAKHLNQHLGALETVFRLERPFPNVQGIFDPGQVRVRPDGLVPEPPDKDHSPRLVLTRRPSSIRSEVRAEFPHPAWKRASHLGLALNASKDQGYTFLLHLHESQRQARPLPILVITPTKDRPETERAYRLQVVRNGRVLREQMVPERAIEAGTLRLWARRDGDRLTFQVNRLAPLEFYDPFPLGGADPGVFGAIWPDSVSLTRLEAARQTRAPVLGPLEAGDDLYARKQYEEALGRYRQQSATAGQGVRGQEARCKAGMCLLALNRIPEARAVFQAMVAEDGPRWPVLAASQLWLSYLSDSDPRSQEEADIILARLAARGVKFGELAVVIPRDVRERILRVGGSEPLNILQTLTRPERTVRRVERRAETVRLFDSDPVNYANALVSLMFVYSQVGDEDRALATGRAILAAPLPLSVTNIPEFAIARTAWILRRRGQAAQALQRIAEHRHRARHEGAPGADRSLLLEQARTRAALGDRSGAEQDLDDFLRVGSPVDELSRLSAYVMKGFLREQANDPAGAVEAWRRGAAGYPLDRIGTARSGEGSTVLTYSIAASLGGVMGETESRKVQGWIAGRLSGAGEASGVMVMVTSRLPPTVVRDMWRTRRGRDLARRFVFNDLPTADYYRLPPLLFGAELLRQASFPGPTTEDQEQLVWDLARAGFTAYATGKLSRDQGALVALVWEGRGSWLWAGLRTQLTPGLRGPIAYLCGQRRLRRKDVAAARPFFETALKDAPPGSRLARLARAELDRLAKPAGPR